MYIEQALAVLLYIEQALAVLLYIEQALAVLLYKSCVHETIAVPNTK